MFKIRDAVSGILNAVIVTGVIAAGTSGWPAKADTTGVAPEYTTTVNSNEFIMDTFTESYTNKEVQCLVENMYHEARSDGYAGMYAVTMVVMNRVQDDRYPNTICDVVYQGPKRESWKTKKTPDPNDAVYYPIRNRCQFSWYCDGRSDAMNDKDAFYQALDIATLVLEISASQNNPSALIDITEGSTHYHTYKVFPNWRHDRGMTKIVRIGDHIFYKWN